MGVWYVPLKLECGVGHCLLCHCAVIQQTNLTKSSRRQALPSTLSRQEHFPRAGSHDDRNRLLSIQHKYARGE
jgi:ferredoxin